MNKLRKVLITAAALGALAVGGAAFAQAQNGSSSPAPVQQSQGQAASDQAEGPDSGSENGVKDTPEANDTADANDAPEANDTSDAHEADGGPNAAQEVEDGN
jgi:hypothetical protein